MANPLAKSSVKLRFFLLFVPCLVLFQSLDKTIKFRNRKVQFSVSNRIYNSLSFTDKENVLFEGSKETFKDLTASSAASTRCYNLSLALYLRMYACAHADI